MKKKIFLLLFVHLVSLFAFAQKSPSYQRCGTDDFNQRLSFFDKDYQKRQADLTILREKIGGAAHKQMSCVTSYEVPVAVHFEGGIGTTAAERECLRYLVSSQIEVLNDAFSGAFLNVGSDACIRFVLGNSNHPAGTVMYPGGPALAIGDPAITYNGAYTCPSGSPCNISTWAGYLNIVVQSGTGVLGIAFLGANFNSFNALTIEACAFGTYSGCSEAGPNASCGIWRYDGGITVVHEIGHFFNLEHVFCNDTSNGHNSCGGGGCNSSTDCDGIADTPAQCESVYLCSATNDNPCTGIAGDPITFPNFMDYGDDGCLNLFTDGQIAVMNAHLAGIIAQARPNINNAPCPNIWNGTLTKSGANTVCSGTSVDACVEVDLINDADAVVEFSDDAGSNFGAGTLTPRPPITVHTITLTPFGAYGIPAGPIYEGDVVLIPATATHPIRTDIAAGGFPSGATRFGTNTAAGLAPISTDLAYTVLVPGTYNIECANHPNSMNGSFTVVTRPKATYCKNYVETNTTCAAQNKTFHARWQLSTQDSDCGLDLQTTNGAGQLLSTDVYPVPQAPPTANIVTSGCTTTVTPICGGSLGSASSPSGVGVETADWNATSGVYTADLGDAAGTITITVNGVIGAPSGCTSTTFVLNTPACLITCPTLNTGAMGSVGALCSGASVSTLLSTAESTITLNGGTIPTDVTIAWFDDAAFTIAATTSPTNTTCAPVSRTYYAQATCVSNSTVTFAAGSVTVTVYPDASGFSVNAVVGSCGTAAKAELRCGGNVIGTETGVTPICSAPNQPFSGTWTAAEIATAIGGGATATCYSDLSYGTIAASCTTTPTATVTTTASLCVTATGISSLDLTSLITAGNTSGTWAINGAANGTTLTGTILQAGTAVAGASVSVTYTITGTDCPDEVYTVTVSINDCTVPTVTIADPCNCVNKIVVNGVEYAQETITVTAPAGQTWALIGGSGLFNASGQALLTDGTVQMSANSTIYTLVAYVPTGGATYTATLNNGITSLSQSGGPCNACSVGCAASQNMQWNE